MLGLTTLQVFHFGIAMFILCHFFFFYGQKKLRTFKVFELLRTIGIIKVVLKVFYIITWPWAYRGNGVIKSDVLKCHADRDVVMKANVNCQFDKIFYWCDMTDLTLFLWMWCDQLLLSSSIHCSLITAPWMQCGPLLQISVTITSPTLMGCALKL